MAPAKHLVLIHNLKEQKLHLRSRHNDVFTCALVPTEGRVGAGFANAKAVPKTASGAKPMLYTLLNCVFAAK